jgi:D-aminoacyl-tRNA deacylase
MIALIQRVSEASVKVDGEVIGAIGRGLLALVAIEKFDSEQEAEKLADRLLDYRVFPDHTDRMNLSVRNIDGGVLLVSQFTLAADTRKGLRPSFAPAAEPSEGLRLYSYLAETLRARKPDLATGRFGADMKVSLINDGPVTFHLRIPPTQTPLSERQN